MKPWPLVGAALAALLAGGCAAGTALEMALHPSTPPPASTKTEASRAEARSAATYQTDGEHDAVAPAKVGKNADIVGRWDGQIDLPKTEKDDPMGQMAAGMAKMMMGSLSLELRSDSTFLISIMVPIEGTYTRNGRTLTLTPTTVAGMTEAEAKELQKSEGKPTHEMKPLKGTISAKGDTITLDSGEDKSGSMVFKRAAPEKPTASTVKPDEKPFVGHWRGTLDVHPSPSATEEEKQKSLMAAKMLKDSLELTLRADNTFKLRMMMELEGKWSLKRGQVVLKIEGIAGMGTPDSSTSEPLELKVAEGGKVLSASKKESGGTESLTFRRQ